MRPEFRSGLDNLTKYIFERTRSKQLGSLVMNGPMFAGLTQSFLDVINAGTVPNIATSWQVSLRSFHGLDASIVATSIGLCVPSTTDPYYLSMITN
jgi:hypothetical protein